MSSLHMWIDTFALTVVVVLECHHTNPANVYLTYCASYMVAASVLLNIGTTARTRFDAVLRLPGIKHLRVLRDPALELLAGETFMVFGMTVWTDAFEAGGAEQDSAFSSRAVDGWTVHCGTVMKIVRTRIDI